MKSIRPAPGPEKFKNIAALSRLMDSQFRIPGTNIRFGLDSLIGLVPGAGDLSTFGVSSYLIWLMAKNGASGYVLARMVLNVLIDSIIGAIPLIGDIFDVAFKANMKNLRLLQEHYVEGRHRGGAWKVVVPVLLVTFLIIAGIVYLTYRLLAWIF